MARIIKTIRETVIIPADSRERLVPLQSPSCEPLRRAEVELAGTSDATDGYRIERRNPWYHELLYTLAGEGRFRSGSKTSRLTPNHLLIARAQTRYTYEVTQPPWRIVWFHVADGGTWQSLREEERPVRRSEQAREVHTAVENLLAESIRGELGSERMMRLLADQVGIYLERELAARDSARERAIRRQMHELWGFVDARLDQPWSVANMARQANMSVSTFHRLAVQYMGSSPKRILFLLRMQRAEELLLNHDYPLKTVAEKLGYSTPFAFSNAFRRYKGCSPDGYRGRGRAPA